MKLRHVVGFAVLALCLTSQASQQYHAAERGRFSDLNLLIISLDTTRADRLRAYGFNEIATPNLDRLAREGVLFRHAMSVAPLTLPAHASLFTGLNPHRHGVRENASVALDAGRTTLAERLRSRGFKTGAFVASYVLDSGRGLDQGFDTYADDLRDPTSRIRQPDEELQLQGRSRRQSSNFLAEPGGRPPVLRMGPLVRRACAIRAPRAISIAIRGAALCRRDRVHGCADRPPPEVSRGPPSPGQDPHRRHRRSRRRPGRTRRADARTVLVRERPARASDYPRA